MKYIIVIIVLYVLFCDSLESNRADRSIRKAVFE